jgi:nucleoid-associated protein YgaU
MKRKRFKRILALLLIGCILAIPFASKAKSKGNINYEKVVVYSGDTLWGIASKYTDDNKDVRRTIYEIRKLNKLDSALINPGQELLVPIY